MKVSPSIAPKDILARKRPPFAVRIVHYAISTLLPSPVLTCRLSTELGSLSVAIHEEEYWLSPGLANIRISRAVL
jgi:hypothetical protein